MKSLSRDAIIRMTGDRVGGGYGSGGGGGLDPAALSGYATQAWVDQNYLSIAFFSKLFKAYDSAATPNEVTPNDTESTITNIKAMFGFWTNQYISALGQNSSGGGGSASALADLTDVNLSSPTNGQALVYNATSGKWENQTIGGGGSGTLTSIGLVMPTGFSVSPATLTADGSFTVSFATGYTLPTTSDVNKGVTAYGWGDHSQCGYATQSWVLDQGYAKASNVYSKTDADSKFLTIEAFENLFNAMASDGSTKIESPYASSVASIKAKFGLWTNQYLSALGLNSSGGGGGASALADLTDVALSSPTNGQVLMYNSLTGKWYNGNVSGGGGGTVTSIATGTGLTGGPITTSGTISINSIYQSYISHGETAYGWGDHALAGYSTPSSVATQMQNYSYISNGTIQIGNSSITPLTSCSGTFWGQSWSTGGSVSGNIEAGSNGGCIAGFDHIELNSNGTLSSYGGYIDFHFNGDSGDYTSRIIEDASGRIRLMASNGVRIGDAVLKWDSTNSALYIEKADGSAAGFYATGFVSALGLSGGSGGQIGFDLIPSTSESYSLGSAANGWKELCLADNDETGHIYINSTDGLTLDSSTGLTYAKGDLYVEYDIHARRFYLDSSRYIYLSNGVLKYYNGTTAKTISLE